MPVDVLIVDDSAAIRKILQRVLTQMPLPLRKVLEAADGREALEAMKQQPVGLILSDINMPNMDGLQLLSALKANDHWKNVPVFMISSDGSHAKVMEAVQLGARGFVRKPFTAIKPRLWPRHGQRHQAPELGNVRLNESTRPRATPADSVW